MKHLSGILVFLGFFLGAPIFLAKVVVGADWGSVLIAYAVWFGLLALFSLANIAGGVRTDEAFGWSLIFSLIATWAAIPVIAVVLRWTGLR